jgi:hypothetical protein
MQRTVVPQCRERWVVPAAYGERRRGRRTAGFVFTMIAVSLGLATFAPVALAQTVVPDMTGETFQAQQNFFDPAPVGELQVNSQCTPTGNATISYTASGPAVGPYPGTFEETGTVLLGPEGTGPVEQGPEARQVLEFSADFTVDSGPNRVTGTKSLDPEDVDPATDFGYCFDFQTDPPSRHTSVHLYASYEATITTPTGRFGDSGTANVVVYKPPENPAEPIYHFFELFTSTGPVVPLPPDDPPCDEDDQGDQDQDGDDQGCENP